MLPNNNPPISVLMPAYNAEEYIAEAIESILNQTFKDYEFIIVDDCSTDNTWQIIKKYIKKDSRIKAHKNEKNLGIAGNRNKLISMAKGDYVIWQDADDISMPYRLEKQYKFMEENPEVGILGGWLQFFNKNGNLSVRKYATDDKVLRRKIFIYSPVAQPAAIIRKKLLDEVGKYDLKYPPAEDIDMSFRIGVKCKFANLPEIIIKYRENNNSATFTKLKKIELDTIEIRKKYVKNPMYKITFFGQIYNFIQYISIFTIPPKLKIWFFNLCRNSK